MLKSTGLHQAAWGQPVLYSFLALLFLCLQCLVGETGTVALPCSAVRTR